MSEVGLRELRNNAASVLRRAQAGEQIVITTRGKPVASLNLIEQPRRRWLPRTELLKRLQVARADAGLREDLSRLAGETTEDLGSIA
jgi:antitoxin (DNA-binding transcriptional repressor) of toxin-antitoxin stability system